MDVHFSKNLLQKKGSGGSQIYWAKFCHSNSEPQQVQCLGVKKEHEYGAGGRLRLRKDYRFFKIYSTQEKNPKIFSAKEMNSEISNTRKTF